MLWCDKYRPNELNEVNIGQDTKLLFELSESNDIPHLMFYGPSGAGKKTRIYALLRKLFDAKIQKQLKHEVREIQVAASGKKVAVNIVSSQYHLEITPSEVGYYDMQVITKVLKSVAESMPLERKKKVPFKVVVINQVDRLSRNAQSALRRTMEVYAKSCRLMLCCESMGNVIDPIRSRCLCIRVHSPTDEEIVCVLQDIAKKEELELSTKYALGIAKASEGNLRRAILILEAAKTECYPFNEKKEIPIPEWKRFIKEKIVVDIVKVQEPITILTLRDRYYTLLTNCIPPTLILQTVLNFLLEEFTEPKLQHTLIHLAHKHEVRIKKGVKPINHLESFTASTLLVIKRCKEGI